MATRLQLKDDPAQFEIETLQGDVSINAMELASALMEICDDKKGATTEQMAKAIREVAHGEAVKKLSDHELFALGCRIDEAYQALGKDAASQPNSSKPTGS